MNTQSDVDSNQWEIRGQTLVVRVLLHLLSLIESENIQT